MPGHEKGKCQSVLGFTRLLMSTNHLPKKLLQPHCPSYLLEHIIRFKWLLFNAGCIKHFSVRRKGQSADADKQNWLSLCHVM